MISDCVSAVSVLLLGLLLAFLSVLDPQVLEPRFNAELFAQILSIPQNKTLLRRHLSTHVVALIGNDTQHKKREAESTPGYVPLLPSAKVKVRTKDTQSSFLQFII